MSHHGSEAGALLAVSVQILSFEPGLYRLSFSSKRRGSGDPDVGFPWAKLEAPPGTKPGHSVIAIQGENGWLARTGDTAIVEVVGDVAPLLLTVYQLAGVDAAPEFMVQRIDAQAAVIRQESPAAVAPAPPGRAAHATAAMPQARGLSKTVSTNAGLIAGVAHVRGRDVIIGADGWIGLPGGKEQLEGFAVTLSGPPGLAIEYSAKLGPDWFTPWARDGEFCGSRGLALPLLGLTARLIGPGAEQFDLHCVARFIGGQEIGPTSAGDLAAAPDGAPLESFRFIMVPANRKVDSAPPTIGKKAKSAAKPRRLDKTRQKVAIAGRKPR